MARSTSARERSGNNGLRSIPWNGGKVHVPTGENDTEFRGVTVGASRQIQGSNNSGLEQRCNGHGARGLDDDFHALPDEPRRRDDLFLADEEDAAHVAAEDRESPWRKRSAQAVGDSVAGVLRLQRTGGQRAIGVIRALRFAAKDAHTRANPLGTEACSAE